MSDEYAFLKSLKEDVDVAVRRTALLLGTCRVVGGEFPDSTSVSGSWTLVRQATVCDDPKTKVSVGVTISGNVAVSTGSETFTLRAGISLDGGVTWTTGNEPRAVGSAPSDVGEPFCAVANVVGVPTGSIMVRLEAQDSGLGLVDTIARMGWLATVMPS